jgi:dsRNA-specific ribonuclease
MVEVWCGGKKIGHGYGENVKKAEFNGAKNAYNIILQNKKIKLNY